MLLDKFVVFKYSIKEYTSKKIILTSRVCTAAFQSESPQAKYSFHERRMLRPGKMSNIERFICLWIFTTAFLKGRCLCTTTNAIIFIKGMAGPWFEERVGVGNTNTLKVLSLTENGNRS